MKSPRMNTDVDWKSETLLQYSEKFWKCRIICIQKMRYFQSEIRCLYSTVRLELLGKSALIMKVVKDSSPSVIFSNTKLVI